MHKRELEKQYPREQSGRPGTQQSALWYFALAQGLTYLGTVQRVCYSLLHSCKPPQSQLTPDLQSSAHVVSEDGRTRLQFLTSTAPTNAVLWQGTIARNGDL